MKMLKINSLGSQNVNFDLEPCDLPAEVFTYGTNYKLVNNKIVSFNMSKTLALPSSNFKSGLILSVTNTNGNFYVLIGQSAAWVYNGSTWSNITSSTGYPGIATGGELLWHSCMLGNIPIFNNAQHYPEYWSPQQITQILQPLLFKTGSTWQTMGYHAKIIRSHKNFLFALNLSEGAATLPSSYRWSHPADINGLPPSWDEANLSYIAGKASVGGEMGALVDGKSLRDNFVLYSERGITILNFVGGEFIWQAQTLTTNYGLLSKNCIAEANGIHYFISDGDILSNDGNSIKSILNKQLKTKLTSNIDAINYVNSFAYTNSIAKEIWFCIPETGNTLPNIAFIFSYENGTTSIRHIPSSTSITFGPNLSVPLLWGGITDTWNSAFKTWSYDLTSVFSKTIICTNNTNSGIISLELDDGTTVQNTILEKLSYPLEGQEIVTTTKSVYPHISCNEPVSIQLGSQDFVGSAVRWKPEVLFNPKTMRKVDIRTTGKLLSWRIKSTGNLPFTLTGLDIEYTTNGTR